MKKLIPFLLVTCPVLALASPPAGAAVADPAEPYTLQVRVNVPPSWQPLLDEHVSEALVDRVREVLYRRDFKGEVEQVDPVDRPEEDWHLITLNLIEWRISNIGNVECTFTASLQTSSKVVQLGVYTNTTMRLMTGPGRFGLARSFEQAAEGAIQQLCDDLARTELVPGLRRR